MKRIVNGLGKLKCGKRACAVFAVCATTAIALSAQTFTTLHIFDGTDGANPQFRLIQAANRDFYGTTYGGGASDACGPQRCGTVFKITPSGELTTLYSFCARSACTDGMEPDAVLVQATNGDFYGTTAAGGGTNYGGTVFKITPAGTLTTLYSFCSQSRCPDGSRPLGGLVQATNGDFYGITQQGGANCVLGDGCGTIFKITPSGTLTTLYSFCSQGGLCPDGSYPARGLVQATNGDLYGTTANGGANLDGTVFKITPTGTLTTLYSFCSQSGCTDGAYPYGGLVQATNGDLYGTTAGRGAASYGGTVFKITPSGTLTTLYSFCSQSGCTDGSDPMGGLVQAADGDLYGTTKQGGANDNCAGRLPGCGTIFKITPTGTLTTLYSFCAQRGCTDGAHPYAALVQATNGDLYGTTLEGGAGDACGIPQGCGTVFRVGKAVRILGTNLIGATSVTSNGTAAAFTVMAPSPITTTVPTGATSGKVKATAPDGTLLSNVAFTVRP